MIRVLVVDDSALMRTSISNMLSSDLEIEVISRAKNGQEALDKTKRLRPDVITMDIHMPQMDGLQALQEIMQENPTPIVMLSAYTQLGADITLKALELGAVDFLSKPSGEISLDISKIREELIWKVKAASKANLNRLNPLIKSELSSEEKIFSKRNLKNVVALGASTGGPRALSEIMPAISADIPANFLIVQHMPARFTQTFAERLDLYSKLKVKEAENNDELLPAHVLVAPGGYHMVVDRDEFSSEKKTFISLNRQPPVHRVRPSIDVMMNSVASIFEAQAIGVLLTGMGNDGVEGLKKIKENGGYTIAEDKSTCVVYGMPRAAIEAGVVDKILPLTKIPQEIERRIQ